MNLKGKTALITGASSGIGKSFAYLLAAKGAHLILVARSKSKLEEIAQDIQQRNQVKTHVYQQDLSQLGSARHLYDQIQSNGLNVDLLINNAGFGKWGKFEDFSLEEYSKMIQLNITSLMDLCHLYIEDFKKKPEAGIINVGSTASFMPVPYSAVYAATKSFVLNFTEGLVGELSSTKIRVFCLCPGGTASNFATVANESGVDTLDAKLMSSDEVAQLGIDAFLANKHYIVTGRRFQILLFKFMSRKRVLTMIADYWRKRLNI